MRIDRDIFYELMTNTKRMIDAEMKLNLLEKDIKELRKNYWAKEAMESLLKKYFQKSLVDKVENVMLEEVVDVQDKTSESNSD